MSKQVNLEERDDHHGTSRGRIASDASDQWEDAQETLFPSSEDEVEERQPMEEDLDLTPRPLRVIKRQEESLILDLDQSPRYPGLRKCRTQCTMIPYRRSSSMMDCTNLDLSQRSSCSPISRGIDRNEVALRVRKQRSGGSGGAAAHLQASSAPENPVPSPPADVHPKGPTTTRAPTPAPAPAPAPAPSTHYPQHRQGSGHDAIAARKAEIRRAGNTLASGATHHTPDLNLSLVGSSSMTGIWSLSQPSVKPWKAGEIENRRCVTLNERSNAPSSKGPNVRPSGSYGQPSIKHRFLNRMMVGLASKPLSAQVPAKVAMIDEAPSSTRESQDECARPRRSSSVYSDDLSDFDRTISSFPTPPTSNVTSPTTVGSFDGDEVPCLAHRSLSIPQQSCTIGATLSLMSDFDEYKSATGVSVAIEVGAVISDQVLSARRHDEANALDVAVVIDNSVHNSPDALMSSCETARCIASFLESSIDRMAIYTTFSGDIDGHKPRPSSVMSLGKIDLRSIKATLDSITNSTAPSDASSMLKAIDEAQRSLIRPEVTFLSPNSSADNTYGHLFVLTADLQALDGVDLMHPTIQSHVVRQGCSSQGLWGSVSCNGWKVDSFASDDISGAEYKQDTVSRGLQRKLQSLLQHARLGQSTGMLKDLHVDIQPGTLYSIESIKGDTKISSLQAGETRTVVVKLKAAGKKVPFSAVSPISLFNPSTEGDSLLSELDRMLGHADLTSLTANLTYVHPLLPPGTKCHLTQYGHLRTKSLDSDIKHLSVENRTSTTVKGKFRVHKDLALQLAGRADARKALRSLQQEFGEEGSRSACPAFVSRLIRELKYQARLADRKALQNSPLKENISLSGKGLNSPNSPFEFEFPPVETMRPENWIRTSEEEFREAGSAPLKAAEELGFDDAHRIWADIRHAAKTVNDSIGVNGENSPFEKLSRKGKKADFVKEKRSISFAPIRNFSVPLRPPRYITGTPWL